MVQDNVPICPRCGGLLRKVHNNDIWYVCIDNKCKTLLKVIGMGQSQRELKCQIQ